jgi:hypothetical protein
MKISERPPARAENAIEPPSGDQHGLRISPSSGNGISRSIRFFATLMIVRSGRPLATAPKTNSSPLRPRTQPSG